MEYWNDGDSVPAIQCSITPFSLLFWLFYYNQKLSYFTKNSIKKCYTKPQRTLKKMFYTLRALRFAAANLPQA